MTKHVHAEMMALYAEDAMQTTKPLVAVEFSDGGSWIDCWNSPIWLENNQYRRKARTITIEGAEFPAQRLRPCVRHKYLLCKTRSIAGCGESWSGGTPDALTYLKNGQIFFIVTTLSNGLDFIVSIATRGREMKPRMRTMVSDAVLVTACCAVVWVPPMPCVDGNNVRA